jgi:hypothetical protein
VTASRLDALLPTYDARERHHARVRASAAATYAAVESADLAASPIVRALLAARALPGALLAGPAGLRALAGRAHTPVTLHTFERQGFRVIARHPPEELVIGLEGRFWTPGGGLRTPPADDFRATPPAPGSARAVWNFTVRELGEGVVELATETRVRCADTAARRRFRPYWALVRPASGAIRRLMLREIGRVAEGGIARP